MRAASDTHYFTHSQPLPCLSFFGYSHSLVFEHDNTNVTLDHVALTQCGDDDDDERVS